MSKSFLALLLFGLLAVSFAHADVIMPGTHQVDRAVTISNAEIFSGKYLLAVVDGPTGGLATAIIKNGEVLEKGYKFNSYHVFWAPKDYVDKVGVTNIVVDSCYFSQDYCKGLNVSANLPDSNLHLVSNEIEPYGGFVDDTDTIQAERITYAVVDNGNGNLTLVKTSYLKKYPIVGWVDQNVMPTPSIQPVTPSRDWLSGILCFFKSLFGGSC